MARYNEILVGRFNRLLQKLFSMKGDAPAPQLSTEIQANWSFLTGVEDFAFQGWGQFSLSALQAGVAAQNSNIRVRNPLSSGVIAVFSSITLAAGTTDRYDFAQDQLGGDLLTVFSPSLDRIDPRSSPQSSIVISGQNNVASSGVRRRILQILASTTFELIQTENQEIALLPGEAFVFTTTNVNEALAVNFQWRERGLEESERIGGASLGII